MAFTLNISPYEIQVAGKTKQYFLSPVTMIGRPAIWAKSHDRRLNRFEILGQHKIIAIE